MNGKQKDNSVFDGCMAMLGQTVAVAGLVIFIIASVTILNGAVLVKLWEWFIIPLFGLPVLDLVFAMGLGLTITFLTGSIMPKGEVKGQKESLKALVYSYSSPLAALLFGYIIQLFI